MKLTQAERDQIIRAIEAYPSAFEYALDLVNDSNMYEDARWSEGRLAEGKLSPFARDELQSTIDEYETVCRVGKLIGAAHERSKIVEAA